MALMKSSSVPKDAVALSELEATTYAWDLLNTWGSASDTWALRYTPAILGGINAMCGILINRHYRMKLKLGTYGYFASVVPISVMPGLMTSLFHRHSVSTNMLLMKNDGCPVCYEIRATVIQCGFGLAYPMVLGPAAALMFAHRYATYRVPDLLEGPKVLFQFLRKITRPYNSTLAMMGVVQFVASSVLTYFELRNNYTFRRKMVEIEKKIMAEKGLDTS